DSVFAAIVDGNITAFSDTTICPGETATLSVIGGVSYTWSPSNTLNTPIGSPVYATPAAPTLYVVNGIDEYGCPHQDSVFVDLFPAAFIQTVPDIHAFYGDAVQLGATSSTNGTFIWSPAEYLSCVACTGPIAQPDQNYVYTVTYVDDNGCSASDHVNIYYDPILYIPNTFTPNNDHDGLNAFFKAEGGNIAEFKMDIYNRWGELIFTANSLDESWDGTYNGAECQDGTYTWKVVLKDFVNINHVHVGHVNIIR
ncbi:MAG: gliding motility-associated-like protein, partial [Crocinitomicaceae bacterium]